MRGPKLTASSTYAAEEMVEFASGIRGMCLNLEAGQSITNSSILTPALSHPVRVELT